MSLSGKHVLITGGAQRIGRALALGVVRAGGSVSIHFGKSRAEGEMLKVEIEATGGKAHLIQADLNDMAQVTEIIPQAGEAGQVHALVNNAAIFEPLTWENTDLESWQRHLNVNLTAPFILSQAFARQIKQGETGRVVNILDWRALRPGADHLPYTISKAALAALTRSLAISLAPNILVNAIALGAILPPSDGGDIENVIQDVPAQRWAKLEEVVELLLFLLDGPEYINGEIIHLDGGRHLI